MTINLILGDCLEEMKKMPDKAYDLAIVDPPYGIGAGMGVGVTRGCPNKYKIKNWDNSRPSKLYFIEL